MIKVTLEKQTHTYFLSDIHLGLDYHGETSAEREMILVDWLRSIEDHTTTIYFLGDIFDYWFEYGETQQPDYPAFFHQLRHMLRLGIKVYFFTGNHDLWMNDFFPVSFGIPVYKSPQIVTIADQVFYLAHGDGLGKGDMKYKIMKKLMTNRLCQKLYGLIPAEKGLALMKSVSQRSRHRMDQNSFSSFEEERLVNYCESHPERAKVNYFLFGHRHLPIRYSLIESSAEYINLGDWIHYKSYAYFDGTELHYRFLDGYPDKLLCNNRK